MVAYEILQWNLGTGEAQNYTLRGTGEHEGTNVTMSAREFHDALADARQEARLNGHKVKEFTLLMDSPKRTDGPEVVRAVAEYLDRRFMHAHAARAAQGIEAGTAETEGLGAKHESPVAEGHAP